MNMATIEIEKIDIPRMLKTEREKRFLTYEDVGKGIGLSASYIFRIEKGKRKKPSFEAVMNMIRFFNLDNERLSLYMEGPSAITVEGLDLQDRKGKELLGFIRKMDPNNANDLQVLMENIREYQQLVKN